MTGIARLRIRLAAVLLCVASAAGAPAQQSDPQIEPDPAAVAAPGAEANSPGAALDAQPQRGPDTRLPRRAGPPRSQRAYWHVGIAYTVVGLLVLGYAASLARRYGRTRTEIARLRRA